MPSLFGKRDKDTVGQDKINRNRISSTLACETIRLAFSFLTLSSSPSPIDKTTLWLQHMGEGQSWSSQAALAPDHTPFPPNLSCIYHLF